MIFKEINMREEIKFNPFSKIGNDWMLITAGDKEKCNTMTASWGAMGVLWNKNIAMAFVRPQRYTFEFIEKNDYYSLCFFPFEHKDKLVFCGKNSGRDVDKIQKTGLKILYDQKAPYFEQANMVFICKKIYNRFIDPECFVDSDLENNYELKDYHKMYIGEIEKCLIKEDN